MIMILKHVGFSITKTTTKIYWLY